MWRVRELLSRMRLEMNLASAAPGLRYAPFLGRYNHRDARPALAEHSHGGAFEVCYLVKGRQTYRVRGRDYHLRGGDVFLTFPDEEHSSGGAPEEKGVLYWMVLVPPRASKAVSGQLATRPDDAFWNVLRGLPARHFPGSAKMKDHLDALTDAFHGTGPLRAMTLHHLVIGFLLELAACGLAPRTAQRRSLDAVRRYVTEHLDEPLSVPQMAKLARLSVPHFKARFREETGVPPAEYQLRARLEEARRRLATGRQTVTEIAFDLGFSSSQYFATVFKRFTGESPSARRGKNRS